MSYRDIKDECYEANLLLPKYKLIDLTFGNVSVADHDRAVFAIKPSGIDYTTLTESDIVVVDFHGQIVDGALRPSSDTPTHRAVLVWNHGPFVWGPTALKAVENAYALEIVAEIALKTAQLNPRVQPISKDLLDKHFLRKHGSGAYYGQG